MLPAAVTAGPALMRHIPHLFVPGPWDGPVLEVDDSQAHHLGRVLKLPDDAAVTYTDGVGQVGSGRFQSGNVLRGDESGVACPTGITLAVSPPRSRDRVRFLVEKAAELGVRRLVWVRLAHTEGRPPAQSKARAWAVAALEQSRGGWLMEIGQVNLADLDPDDLVVADPAGDSPVSIDRSTLLVGPEGGFSDDEIPGSAARMGLGPTVLRVETAAIAGVTLLAAHRHAPGN